MGGRWGRGGDGVRRGIIPGPTQGIISRRGMGMVLGGKFQVPPHSL